MSGSAPPIDRRTAGDVARQIEALLRIYAPTWNETDPATGRATGISAALIGVASRFAELVIQRLNQAPDKNQLAFLDLLGASPMPPQPARVPLMFSLAAGANSAVVPARTQVAAPPGPGAKAPVIFETEVELALTPAVLRRVVSWDAPSDTLAEHDRVADPQNAVAVTLFRGDTPQPHMLGIRLDALFGFGRFSELRVRVDLTENLPDGVDPRSVQWELWDGTKAIPLPPVAQEGTPGDTTNVLTRSGTLHFGYITVRELGGFATGRLLRARLLNPVTRGDTAVPGQVRASHLPRIAGAQVYGQANCGPFVPDYAFAGSTPLDVSRDFFPFGPQPQFGSIFYFASDAVLSRADNAIEIFVTLTDPASGIPNANPNAALRLRWEFWNGQAWIELGTSGPGGEGSNSAFTDNTGTFRLSSQLYITYPQLPRPTVVNGIEAYWMRVRLIAGAYTQRSAGAPYGPSLANFQLTFSNRNIAGSWVPADALIPDDGMHDTAAAPPLTAFAPADDHARSLYLGFALPLALTAFPQLPVSLYAELDAIRFGTAPDSAGGGVPRLAWSYWNGAGWRALAVSDGTEALTVSGPIAFLPPSDFTPSRLFGSDGLYWVRATWRDGVFKFLPRLRRLLLNTVMGEQAVTVRSEVLGSSTGEAGQIVTASQAPILTGVKLEVLEAELPSAEERTRVLADEGADAIMPIDRGAVRVRWHEVSDFYASGPRDRHYVLDHLTGQVRFGDGQAGMIPPIGSGNLVLAGYRTGGGSGGNLAADTIRQLKTTLPYVDRVTNPIAAAGGVGAETMPALRIRAPRSVRHGGRAVTAEDFEDITRLASPEVARVRAVPLIDLTLDPDGLTPRPGCISVIIVPNAEVARPAPSVELVDRVSDALRDAALPGLELVVVGPEYIRVDVHAELSLSRLEGAGGIEAAALAAVTAFLNPLTGGPEGSGWDFGRRPFRSDLVALLQSIPGVDHLRLLSIDSVPDRPGTEATSRFLVCSGNHRIDLVFGE